MRRRLYDLEREASRLYAELASTRVREPLPGLYIVVDVAGHSAVVPATAVCEIVRLVEMTPLPKSPPHVLGTFIYRGTAVTAVDLAAYLGRRRQVPLDAHVAVLASSRPVALVADRVRTLLESPLMADGELPAAQSEVWKASHLVVGLCEHQGEVLPILGIAPLVASLEVGE